VVERAIVGQFGDREVLVATKDGRLVVLVPSDPPATSPGGTPDVEAVLQAELRRVGKRSQWRVAAGRPHLGAYGIARSYEEAREALTLAERLHFDTGALHGRDLLVYRVIGRDQAAIVDLVHSVLTPLTRARGGAEPLLHTLQAYFATGDVATETARRMHLSVRAVTYRLAKVKALTGLDTAEPSQRFALQVAVLGARLLDWPAQELPSMG
jgi:sugar diacid utilization regulator